MLPGILPTYLASDLGGAREAPEACNVVSLTLHCHSPSGTYLPVYLPYSVILPQGLGILKSFRFRGEDNPL